MHICVVHGDLLDQDVDAIVNAWNRNVIPWWLLLPQGVSGTIKRRADRSAASPLVDSANRQSKNVLGVSSQCGSKRWGLDSRCFDSVVDFAHDRHLNCHERVFCESTIAELIVCSIPNIAKRCQLLPCRHKFRITRVL